MTQPNETPRETADEIRQAVRFETVSLAAITIKAKGYGRVAIDQFEVVGAFSPRDFGTLVRTALRDRFASVTEIDATDVIGFLNDAGISVFVTVDFADGQVRYPATLTRFRGAVDDETGSVGLAVRVDNPLKLDPSRQRPPLEIGSFVTVQLEATPRNRRFLCRARWSMSAMQAHRLFTPQIQMTVWRFPRSASARSWMTAW